MNKKDKQIIWKIILTTISVWILMFGIGNVSASAASGNETGQGGEKINDSNVWTLYAELLMGNENVKDASKKSADVSSESGFWHPIDKTLGSNGVSVDMPFTYMSNYGNSYSSVQYGGNAGSNGRLLASMLATYSNYNMFETVSGNAVASTASGMITGLGRVIGGVVGTLALLLDKVANGFRDVLTNVAVSLNPFNLLGYGDATNSTLSKTGKPIYKAINSFFDAMGINKALFKVITGLTFLIVTGIFGARLMMAISSNGLKPSWKHRMAFNAWFQKFLALFIIMPLEGFFLGVFAQGIQSYKAQPTSNTNTVLEHIVNDRNWAFALNLSPNGENGSVNMPSAWAKQSYIDPSFNPAQKSVQKNIITPINVNGYKATGLTDKTDMALDLLQVWTSNSTFNVNTYAGDVIGVQKNFTPPVLAGGANEAAKSVSKSAKTDAGNGKKYPSINSDSTRRDLAAYIWSADQSPSDDSVKPNGKGRGAGYSFVASANFGVQANSTFSTQSVALLLQSSFDNQGAHFYAYNIAPSGAQGKAKNLSTVKTEWRAASLVGDGMFGQFASWFEMIAESLSHSVLVLAAVWALLTIELIGTLKTLFLRMWQFGTTLSMGPAAGVFAYGIAIYAVVLMTFNVPDVVISLVSTITSAIPGFFGADNFGAPVQLISSFAVLGVTYLLAFKTIDRYNSTAINYIMSFPLELAKQFDKKAMSLQRRSMVGRTLSDSDQNLATAGAATRAKANADSDTSMQRNVNGTNEAVISALTADGSGNDIPTQQQAGDATVPNTGDTRRHNPQTANSAKLRRELAKRKGSVPNASDDRELQQDHDGELKPDNSAVNPRTGVGVQTAGVLGNMKPHVLIGANGKPLSSSPASREKERSAMAKGGLSALSKEELAKLNNDDFNPANFNQDVAKSQHLSDVAFNEDAAKDKLAEIDDGKYLREDENGEKVPDLKAISTAMKIGDSPYATEEQRETAEKLKAARDAGAQSLREKALQKNGYNRNGEPVLTEEESKNVATNSDSKKDFDAMFKDDRHLQDVATSMPSAKQAISNLDNSDDYFSEDADGKKHLDLNKVHEDIMAGTQPAATPQQKQLSSSLMSAQQAGKNELRHNTQRSIKRETKAAKPGAVKRMQQGAKNAVNSAHSGSLVAMLRDGTKAVNQTVEAHNSAKASSRREAIDSMLKKRNEDKK